MPILIVMMIIITIRGITLDGSDRRSECVADTGLWGFDRSRKCGWRPMGKVFFSLSVGFATMITYASYLKKDEDLSNSGLIAALSTPDLNLWRLWESLVPSASWRPKSSDDVQGVVASGVGLAFVVFPQIINELPWLNSMFGVFFASALLSLPDSPQWFLLWSPPSPPSGTSWGPPEPQQ